MSLRLLCIFAHPDDESLGPGPTLARYAAEGVETYLLTATRGERGWQGVPAVNPGLTALGQLREAELQAAARHLGLREVRLLDYIDGDLDQAPPAEAIAQIAAYVRQVQPHVVITFAHDGAYGHPDHIAISQFTCAALVCAADASPAVAPHLPPWRVSKLYFMVNSQNLVTHYEAMMGGPLAMEIDGVVRRLLPWPDWAITTRIDTQAHWPVALAAAECHATQQPTFAALIPHAATVGPQIFGEQCFYRVFSLVNGGRVVERDLFDGLRA